MKDQDIIGRQTTALGRIRTLLQNATRPERGCVQSTSRSMLKSSAASGVFHQASLANLLRLVFDTAALRSISASRSLNAPASLAA
jgi:hypothetical protein